jgi:GDPmannose 4,6-dehydratase
MKVIITGSNGQDGYYMCEYLLKKGYDVIGIDKNGTNDLPITQLVEDISNELRLKSILDVYSPDEIYNFGGNSNNLDAFDQAYDLLESNAKPIITILDYLREHKNCKLFQASSALIFGNDVDDDGMQRENTRKDPTTPYGAAKLYAFNMIQTYKIHYKIFAVNGILYNHESIRRKPNFLLPKVVKAAIDIKKGLTDTLELNDLHATRSWIHAKDVVDAAYKSLQQKDPFNYIICGNKLITVEYVVYYVFSKLTLDYHKYVTIKKDFDSKQENNYLGENLFTRIHLNWQPTYCLEKILDELIDYYNNQ